MKEIDIVRHIPYFPPGYEENEEILYSAALNERKSTVAAQGAFSHIILNRLWSKAMEWYDPRTGVLFESLAEVPDDIKQIVSSRRRFDTQGQFMDWCAENIPGFVPITYQKRHSLIDKLYETGMDFNKAVALIAGGKMLSVTELSLRALEFAEDHTVIGYNEEITERLFDVMHRELPQGVSEEQKLEVVKEAVREYVEEKEIPISQGASPRAVTGDVRRELIRKRRISIISQNELGYPLVVQVENPGGNPYSVDDQEYFFIQFFDENNRVKKAPEYLIEWIKARGRTQASREDS